jgi:Protein of unknown function (DUF4199)
MKEQSVLFWKSAINNGIILGVVLIILQVIMWMSDFIPVGIVKGLLTFVIYLVLYIIVIFLFTKNYRNKELSGYITYGNAFLYGLVVFMISTILVAIYNYIFLLFIDPEYTARVMQATINWTENFMRSKGVSELEIDKNLDKIRSKPLPSPLNSSLKSILFGVIIGGIVSLISSAFAKKEGNPLHDDN